VVRDKEGIPFLTLRLFFQVSHFESIIGMKVQFFTDDNYQTMYINGKQVLGGHSLNAEDVAVKILGGINVHRTILWEIEDELEGDERIWNGILLWEDGVGHPLEYPFEYE